MTMPLFGGADRDRVAHATLAVLARLDLGLVGDLLREAAGLDADLPGVRLDRDTGPLPRMTGHVDWWFEISTRPGGYDVDGPARDRVRDVARQLGEDAWLFVLSPDPPAPPWLVAPDGVDEATRSRIAWCSFRWLTGAVRVLLADPLRPVGDVGRMLLGELLALYAAEGLLDDADELEQDTAPVRTAGADTLVVSAERAWRDYLDHAAYLCPPGEMPGPGVTHVAFERDGRLMAVVPRIVERVPMLALTRAYVEQLRADGDAGVAAVVEAMLDSGGRDAGPYALALLSGASDVETVCLTSPVHHNGGGRFARLGALRNRH